jgi:hypothetical protein
MRVRVRGIWMDKMSMVVWSIPMVFSLFPISFIFFQVLITYQRYKEG